MNRNRAVKSTERKGHQIAKIVKKNALLIARQLLMILLVIVVTYPIFFMFITSLKTKMEYIKNKVALPKKVVISNYGALWEDKNLLIWFRNSTVVTVLAVSLSTVVAALAAYSFARIRFIGKDKIFNFIISLMVIPPIVMIIPLFVVMTNIRLVNTYWSAIIIYTGLILPFSIYLLRNFFVTIPGSIIDSARIDGCSDLGIFIRIILPLSRSAIITLIIVNSLWVWNELLIAMIFLQKRELRTLMAGLIRFQGRFQINQPVIMAGLLVSILPMMLIYLFGQKYFVSGLTTGAVKGE
jgi:ABC-type glycerol-3-phosphate transport system permease component